MVSVLMKTAFVANCVTPGQLKSLRTLINRSGSHLETLQLDASIQAQRAQIIQSLLPTDLQHEVATGDLNSGLLTLYVPQAALAARLRFEESSLIDALQSDPLFPWHPPDSMPCQTTTKLSHHPSSVKPTRSNPKAAETIQRYSETLNDEELKRQFQQLAARVSGNPPPDRR